MKLKVQILVLALTCLALFGCSSQSAGRHCDCHCPAARLETGARSDLDRPVARWEADLVPCSLENCGGYPQNVATMKLREGSVVVRDGGEVEIKLRGLSRLGTNEPAAYTDLEVFVGRFGALTFSGNSVGVITTDKDGNYDGKIETLRGPYLLPAHRRDSNIILNRPSVRSEFITSRD